MGDMYRETSGYHKDIHVSTTFNISMVSLDNSHVIRLTSGHLLQFAMEHHHSIIGTLYRNHPTQSASVIRFTKLV